VVLRLRLPTPSPCVSIVIPVYNEAPYVRSVLDAVRAAELPAGVRREIICVNDGSSDGTRAILDSYGSGIVVHHSPLNCGKGRAIRLGLERVTGDVVVIQDADLEYDPADYPALLAPILDGRATVVYGSRFLGECQGMRWPNRIVTLLLAWLVRVLYGQPITDEATCYKAFRADVLRALPLRCERFEFCPEVTALLSRRGHRIVEVPIRYRARTSNQGKKIRWTDAVAAAWMLIALRVRE
jgi:glycosyltransferase involved in cell wall biosynthesis